MSSRAVLALLALTACGRIGFGEQSPGDASSDGGAARWPLQLPEGGTILQVAVAPNGTWYARTPSSGVYRSRDEGMSWVACANGPPPTGVGIGADNTVYLSGSSMRVSTDECDSFTTLATARYSNHTAPGGSFMYALTDQGIERRSNGAWTQVLDVPGTPFGPFAARVAGAPLLVAGTNNSGVYTSDLGAVWTGFATPNIRGVAIGATKSYAISGAAGTASGGISCGNADGSVWAVCVSYGGVAIAVDPTDEDHVVAAVYDELAETTNGFMTSQVGRREAGGMPDALARGVAFTPAGALIVASNRGVFVSPPGPLAFEPRNSGLFAWTIDRLVVDGDDLFAATEGGLARSIGGAALAIDTTGIPSDVDFNDVAIASNGDIIGLGRGVWRSADRGVTWTRLYAFPDADDYHAYSIELGANGRIYAGSQRRLLVSDPPHATWSPRSVGALATKIDELLLHEGQLWAGTNMGLFVATVAQDLAGDVMTFARIADVGGGVASIAPLADGGLLVGTSTGVWTSDATRSAWTQRMARATRTVLRHGDVLLAATSEGVFASRDDGGSWTVIPESDGRGTGALAIDPGSGEVIYGVAGRGLARAAIP